MSGKGKWSKSERGKGNCSRKVRCAREEDRIRVVSKKVRESSEKETGVKGRE